LISALVVPEDEEKAGRFEELLDNAYQAGALGALAWSHENVFDIPVAESFSHFAVSNRQRVDAPSRIHVAEDRFYADPKEGLRAAYEAYQKNQKSAEGSHESDLLVP
jgi:hypothetical protein